MNYEQLAIPRVHESYALARVVWYSHLSGEVAPLSEEAFDALANLNAIRNASREKNWSGGVELATNGESDVAGLQWSKDTQTPVGVLGLTLLPRKDYLSLIQPDDVLLVYLQGDKVASEYLLALISVDSVDEGVTVVNGTEVTRINVQGRDLGKVLMETPTVFDAAFGGLVISQFFQEFLSAFSLPLVQGGPSTIIQVMLSIYYSLRQNFVTVGIGKQVPDSDAVSVASTGSTAPLRTFQFPGHPTASLLSFLDIATFVQVPMVGALLAPATLLQSGANLWSLCDMYANRVINEFFVDVRDLVEGHNDVIERLQDEAETFMSGAGASDDVANQKRIKSTLNKSLVPQSDAPDTAEFIQQQTNDKAVFNTQANQVIALVHRQMPYDSVSFQMLPGVTVYETEVYDTHITRATHDIRNLFRLRIPGIVEPTVNTSQGVNQDQVFGLTINRDSIRKHGIKLFEGETIYPYVSIDTSNPSARVIAPTFDYVMGLVTTWYAYNELMFSGTLTCRLRPDIRIGMRLQFVRSRHGKYQVFDFYVQAVQHSYSPQPGSSRTTVQLERGIFRADGLVMNEDQLEGSLFWDANGRNLPQDPYEIVIGEDQIVVGSGG